MCQETKIKLILREVYFSCKRSLEADTQVCKGIWIIDPAPFIFLLNISYSTVLLSLSRPLCGQRCLLDLPSLCLYSRQEEGGQKGGKWLDVPTEVASFKQPSWKSNPVLPFTCHGLDPNSMVTPSLKMGRRSLE